MTVLFVVLAFLAFTLVIWSVHAINGYALAQFGYAPFSMPNMLLMLVPHGLMFWTLQPLEEGPGLHSVLANGAPGVILVLLLILAATIGMFLVIGRRTNRWVALYAAPLMVLSAAVLVWAVLFWTFALFSEDSG